MVYCIILFLVFYYLLHITELILWIMIDYQVFSIEMYLITFIDHLLL